MLNKLALVQVDASELACMSSIAHIGTKNSNLQLSKRPLPEDLKQAVEQLNSIRGSKKRRKIDEEKVIVLLFKFVYQFATIANCDDKIERIIVFFGNFLLR